MSAIHRNRKRRDKKSMQAMTGWVALMVMLIQASLMIAHASQPPLPDAPSSHDALGWRWYHDAHDHGEPQPHENTPISEPDSTTITLTPTKQMHWYHRYYDDIKHDAVLNPNDPSKVERLMRLNQFMQTQASTYGMTMKQVLLQQPELSYALERPTEQAARPIYLAAQRAEQQASVQQLIEQGYGLWWIYHGNDPIAQALAPSLQQFSDQHELALLGISQDGHMIETITHNRIDDKALIVPFTPALIAVNPTTGDRQPLAYGFIDQASLLERLHHLATGYAPDF